MVTFGMRFPVAVAQLCAAVAASRFRQIMICLQVDHRKTSAVREAPKSLAFCTGAGNFVVRFLRRSVHSLVTICTSSLVVHQRFERAGVLNMALR